MHRPTYSRNVRWNNIDPSSRKGGLQLVLEVKNPGNRCYNGRSLVPVCHGVQVPRNKTNLGNFMTMEKDWWSLVPKKDRIPSVPEALLAVDGRVFQYQFLFTDQSLSIKTNFFHISF